MTLPLVHVVGLGPGGPDLLTSGTLDVIEAVPTRLLRTVRHPAASAVTGGRGLDHHYERAERIDDVYPAIVDEVVATAVSVGEVVYAVPGSPVVAERTVELLLADDRVRVTVHPALSFADLTWVRLGIDPVAVGVRLVDAHRFAVEAAGERGPLLVCQCDSRFVLSDVKLAVDDPPSAPVLVLQRLGLPDESVTEVAWEDLDRAVEPDHLTSLWVPELAAPVAREVARLDGLVRTLRLDDPWKAAQTQQSLQPYLLEETFEVLEALDRVDLRTGEGTDDLVEELGDLLYQVVLHAVLGAEAGWFDLSDVAAGIHDKLVRRHPHLFAPGGTGDGPPVEQLVADWEAAKRAEKGRTSILDGIPDALPALALAAKVARKAAVLGPVVAAAAGDDWSVVRARLDAARDAGTLDDETLAAALVALVDLAVAAELDPEGALRRAVARRAAVLRAVEPDPVAEHGSGAATDAATEAATDDRPMGPGGGSAAP